MSGDPEIFALESEELRVVLLPRIGGKIVSLFSKRSAREYLLQPMRAYREARPGDSFEQYDVSGFDDCFPTVAPCLYPVGRLAGTALPDHGDLWSRSWAAERRGSAIELRVQSAPLPALFSKRVSLHGSTLRIDYDLESASEHSFRYLWSAHPLFALEDGMRIGLPAEVRELRVEWSSDALFGEGGQRCAWPVARTKNGRAIALDTVGSSKPYAVKTFTSSLRERWATLIVPRIGESLTIRFDDRTTSHLGLWLCNGGWTPGGPEHKTIALEPCTAPFDSLAQAIEHDCAPVLDAGGRAHWSIAIDLIHETSHVDGGSRR